MKNNFTKEEAENLKEFTHVWVIDTMPNGSLRPFCTKNNLHTYEINGVEQVEVYADDEWGTFFPSEIFLTESDCLSAAWALNYQNYVKATNLYDKNRDEILSKLIDTNKTPKTLTELCGAAPDSFHKYLKEQEELATMENLRIEQAILKAISEEKKRKIWIRARFHVNLVDPRPVLWPPPGPYWISGEGDDYCIIIAYVKEYEEILKFWPDATDIDCDDLSDEITYSSRFPKPKWYEQS